MAETISRKSVIYDIDYDFKQGNKSAQEAEGKLQKVDKTAAGLGNTFKGAGKSFEDAFKSKKAAEFGAEIISVTNKSKSLVQQLRALRNELATMDEGSAKFQKMSIEAAKLEDRIGDVNQRIRNLASDTKNLDAFVSIATGIAGGFAVAQGAVALFGDENKELQKTLLKVQASIAILNGLQQVSATIQNESAAKTFIVTNAQKLYTFVVRGATLATQLFNAALIATIGGAVLVGLAAIVAYWSDIAKFIGLANDESESFNKVQDSILDKRIKLTELAGKQTFDLREKQLRNELAQTKTSADRQLEILGELDVLKAEREKTFANEQRQREKESVERRLELVKKGSNDELELKKELIDISARIELAQVQRTQDEIFEILSIAERKKAELQRQAGLKQKLKFELDFQTAPELEKEVKPTLDTIKKLQDEINKVQDVLINTRVNSDDYKTALAQLTLLQDILDDIRNPKLSNSPVTPPEDTKDKEEKEKKEREALNEAINYTLQISKDLNEIQEQNAEREINSINEQAETQIAAIEKQIAAKQKLGQETVDLEQKIKDIEAQRAQREKEINDRRKKNALTLIVLEQAVALAQGVTLATKATTPIEFIAAVASILATIISTISQAKAVANSASFFEGTEYLHKGKNKSGKDTIPIMANEGEAIIPTDKNAQEPGLAKAWIDGTLDKYIYRNYVMPEMIRATGKTKSEKDYSEKFYRQWLETKETNGISKKALGVLTRIERGLSSDYYKSRYNA